MWFLNVDQDVVVGLTLCSQNRPIAEHSLALGLRRVQERGRRWRPLSLFGDRDQWESGMGAQKTYEKLIRLWGRELANEIMAKKASQKPFTKRGKKSKNARKWSPVLPGSFESGKRR